MKRKRNSKKPRSSGPPRSGDKGKRDARKGTPWKKTSVPCLYQYTPKGTFYARVRTGAKVVWSSLKTTVFRLAKTRLPGRIAELHRQAGCVASAAAKITDMTFGAFADLYKERLETNVSLKPRTKATCLAYLRGAIHRWPGVVAMDIRRIGQAECRRWLRDLREKGTGAVNPRNGKENTSLGPTRWNGTLDTLKAIFEIAKDAAVIAINPVDGIKRLRVIPEPLDLPSTDQLLTLIHWLRAQGRAAAARAADWIDVLSSSGMRVGEAGALLWEHVAPNCESIVIRGPADGGTKNGEPRRLDANQDLEAALIRMKRSAKGGVLPATSLKKWLKRGCAAVGIEPALTPHDLRHFFITACLEGGVDVPTVADWVGHKDGGALILARYVHVRKGHKRAMARRLSITGTGRVQTEQ